VRSPRTVGGQCCSPTHRAKTKWTRKCYDILAVYTVRKITLYEGELTNPEAVGTDFTKESQLPWCKTLLLTNFGGGAFTVWRPELRRDQRRQSMTAISGLHHSALNDL